MASVNIKIKFSPEQLAEEFCELDSTGQAMFFNRIAEVSSPWLNMQLQYITEDDGLTLHGRRVMQYIGYYSHWGIVCQITKKYKDYLYDINQ